MVRTRCGWVNDDPLYVAYHDEEWGVPVRDDRRLFEMLILEGAQAGLSWYTILKKREAYRRAFDGFDPERVARYDERKVASLLEDPGIVRNRLKVHAAIGNARAWLDLRASGMGFSDFPVGARRRRAGRQPMEAARRRPGLDPGLRGDEQGAQAPRVPLRRPYHLLCVHAGGGDGERPRHVVLSLERVQGTLRGLANAVFGAGRLDHGFRDRAVSGEASPGTGEPRARRPRFQGDTSQESCLDHGDGGASMCPEGSAMKWIDSRFDRRRWLEGAAAVGLSLAAGPALGLTKTPRQTTGPFLSLRATPSKRTPTWSRSAGAAPWPRA